MVNIFTGNGAARSSYNISQTDFVTMSQAMASIPAIHRRVIQNIALTKRFGTPGKEAEFWRNIYDGCPVQ